MGRKAAYIRAVDGISFEIDEGQTFALVGESGCGKTTTGRLILRLMEPTSGTVEFMGHDLFRLSENEMRGLRSQMQIVFQDPFTSLNPRKTVRDILSQPFSVHTSLSRGEIDQKIVELLELVGLTPPEACLDRYSHEFSGGQRQRIGIARAIALNPKFIVMDEPVSALDMSVRGQVLNLINRLKKQLGITMLFISHDLAVVRQISDRVTVMYLGRLVESADVGQLFGNPLHPYTQAILSATPTPNPRRARARKRIVLKGDVQSITEIPSGCRFYPRCPKRSDECTKSEPQLRAVGHNHVVACCSGDGLA